MNALHALIPFLALLSQAPAKDHMLFGTIEIDGKPVTSPFARLELSKGSAKSFGVITGGTYSVRGLESGEWDVALSVRKQGRFLGKVIVPEDVRIGRVDLDFAAGRTVSVVMETPEKKLPLVDALMGARLRTRAPRVTLWVVATVEPLSVKDRLRADVPRIGAGEFSAGPRGGLLRVFTRDPVNVSVLGNGVVVATKRLDKDDKAVSFALSVKDVLDTIAAARSDVREAPKLVARPEPKRLRAAAPGPFANSDPAGLVVHGIVRVGNRGGARVRGDLTGPGRTRSFLATDEQGRFIVAGLTPGPWKLRFDSPRFAALTRELALDPSKRIREIEITLEARPRVKVEALTQDRSSLERAIGRTPGLVRASGWISFVATNDEPHSVIPFPGERRALAWLRSDGSAEARATAAFNTQPSGKWISVLIGDAVLESKRIGGHDDSVRFEVAPKRAVALTAPARVRVIDAEAGTPVSALVEVWDGHMNDPNPAEETSKGVFVSAKLRPSLIDLTITDSEYERVRICKRLAPGKPLDFGTVRLLKAKSVTGRVIVKDGRPPQYTTLEWYDASRVAELAALQAAWQETWIEPDGTFDAENLGARRYYVRVDGRGFAPTVRIVDVAKVTTPLDFELKRGQPVDFELRLPPYRDYWLTVRDHSGLPHWSKLVDRAATARLRSGRYTLEVANVTGKPIKKLEFEVGNEAETLVVNPDK